VNVFRRAIFPVARLSRILPNRPRPPQSDRNDSRPTPPPIRGLLVGKPRQNCAGVPRQVAELIPYLTDTLRDELVDWQGDYFQVDSARLWDRSDTPVGIEVSMTGPRSVEQFGVPSDHVIAVEPDATLSEPGIRAGRPQASRIVARIVGQVPVCWDRDRDAAVDRAWDQLRWFGGGWKVNADLPTTATATSESHCPATRMVCSASERSSRVPRFARAIQFIKLLHARLNLVGMSEGAAPCTERHSARALFAINNVEDSEPARVANTV
jgi:hypothetical protein